MKAMDKAVFFDKDGTLIHNVPYNADPARVRFYEDAIGALQRLHARGYKIVIITNQPGIALGYFPEQDIEKLKQFFAGALHSHHIPLAGFYYCPHHPEGKEHRFTGDCECRKPRPGLLIRAAKELNIDLAGSWMIGDILNDVEAGNRAGCRTILINNGNETEWVQGEGRTPAFTVNSLREAAEKVISEERPPVTLEKGGLNERAFKGCGR